MKPPSQFCGGPPAAPTHSLASIDISALLSTRPSEMPCGQNSRSVSSSGQRHQSAWKARCPVKDCAWSGPGGNQPGPAPSSTAGGSTHSIIATPSASAPA